METTGGKQPYPTPRMGYTRIETERAGDARRARDAMVEHWRERGESTGEGLNRLCPEIHPKQQEEEKGRKEERRKENKKGIPRKKQKRNPPKKNKRGIPRKESPFFL